MNPFIDRSAFLIKAIIICWFTKRITITVDEIDHVLVDEQFGTPKTTATLKWLSDIPDTKQGALELAYADIKLKQVKASIPDSEHIPHEYNRTLKLITTPNSSGKFCMGFYADSEQYADLRTAPITRSVLGKLEHRPVLQEEPTIPISGNMEDWEERFVEVRTFEWRKVSAIVVLSTETDRDCPKNLKKYDIYFFEDGEPSILVFDINAGHCEKFLDKLDRNGFYNGWLENKKSKGHSGAI